MGAVFYYSFKKSFELDEEKINKILSLLKERIKNHEMINFKITREDSYVYRTTNIDDLLREDNDSTNRLKEILISYYDDELDVYIEFSKRGGVTLSIKGENRDNVTLLVSYLNRYINKEVANKINLNWLTMTTVAILSFGAMMLILYNIEIPVSNIDVRDVLASNDINKKLNFIIEQSIIKTDHVDKLSIITVVTPLLICAVLFYPIDKIYSYLFPKNNFVFGKQISIMEKIINLRKNLFWGLIISSLISITSAIITSR